ncbi:uncharacterized protein LOC132732184 isoform X3 [Ruditapes philippinarum]|uniref:uncharacterized protein LOC132732184 isoform X3 n=1 Tax=Ruditapes philippinarum TaxID=129788 RepID=UPI00295BD939|nr:uncharacterized protein LOC132732184 isoform X3 [Ruditapes philippinarum]
MSNRKRSNMQPARQQLPPIIPEDDGQLPFFKQDFFSDVALLLSGGRKLYTSRCILAYNSPVFEKMLGNAKKHDLDLSQKNADDIVELMCYLDPRVPYTINAQSAKQLLPLSEEYEMHRLRKQCEQILYSTYINVRKEYPNGGIPSEINEEYLLLADRYGINDLIQMCVDEYVSNSGVAMAKVAVNSDNLSERVKLLILRKKLSKLNTTLEKERRHKAEAEMKANRLQPKSNWHKYWHVDEGPASKHRPGPFY